MSPYSLFAIDTPMKTTQRPQPVVQDDDRQTRIFFNIFMILLALGLVAMVAMLLVI